MYSSKAENEDQISEAVPLFSETLKNHHLSITRKQTDTLQINTGFLCNQVCKHCHLSCGPDQKDNMNRETAEKTMEYAARCGFDTIDITGGAPEMNPNLPFLIEESSKLSKRVMYRSNLTALYDLNDNNALIDLLTQKKIVIVASMPAVNESQTDAQRGKGSFNKSIDALKMLNDRRYGQKGSGLELNLVANPAGAFMPAPQEQAEKRFSKLLDQKYGITFNNLFTFANMPLGRFKTWLEKTDNYDKYLQTLSKGFNPCTIDGLMCRTQISVSWDGYLYDCDFNLANGLPKGQNKIHVSEMDEPPRIGDAITIKNHCYACTAGTGFT